MGFILYSKAKIFLFSFSLLCSFRTNLITHKKTIALISKIINATVLSEIFIINNTTLFILLPHNIISDRKSTRLNSSHVSISYAVFCLKKKKPHKNERFDHVR